MRRYVELEISEGEEASMTETEHGDLIGDLGDLLRKSDLSLPRKIGIISFWLDEYKGKLVTEKLDCAFEDIDEGGRSLIDIKAALAFSLIECEGEYNEE